MPRRKLPVNRPLSKGRRRVLSVLSKQLLRWRHGRPDPVPCWMVLRDRQDCENPMPIWLVLHPGRHAAHRMQSRILLGHRWRVLRERVSAVSCRKGGWIPRRIRVCALSRGDLQHCWGGRVLQLRWSSYLPGSAGTIRMQNVLHCPMPTRNDHPGLHHKIQQAVRLLPLDRQLPVQRQHLHRYPGQAHVRLCRRVPDGLPTAVHTVSVWYVQGAGIHRCLHPVDRFARLPCERIPIRRHPGLGQSMHLASASPGQRARGRGCVEVQCGI